MGTDPILRQTIWLHLRTLCDSGVTVILTTHYIEEARNANVVAFMRNGTILAEEEPKILLNKYLSSTLEEVFLKLCNTEDNNNNNNSFDIEIQNNCYENEIIDEMNEFNWTAIKNNARQMVNQNKLGNKFENTYTEGHFRCQSHNTENKSF